MERDQKIEVKATDEALKGVYSNAMQISHTKEEFYLDFFLLHPPVGQLVQRLVVSPTHVKKILTALKENVDLYEKSHKPIKPEKETRTIGFKTN